MTGSGVSFPLRNILGQQTGKPENGGLTNTPEAITLLKMIGSVDWMQEGILNSHAIVFLTDMYNKVTAGGVRNLQVTGRQLFWLRDIKDRLVDKGIL